MASGATAAASAGPPPTSGLVMPPPSGPWSPSSAASEDTEVTIPTAGAASASGEPPLTEEEALAESLRSHEDIRFASYRAAAKLRSLQKQTYLHHIDIWNMIEAFRESGMHALDPAAKLSESKVQALIKCLYDSLQKRLPPSTNNANNPQQPALGENGAEGGSSGGSCSGGNSAAGGGQGCALKAKSRLLNDFMWQALCKGDRFQIKVRTAKTTLATLCTGKLMDKLRYVFSQLSDGNGHLNHSRFNQYLRDIMKIPAAVGEFTSFEENDQRHREVIFDPTEKVTVNDFLETMMSDPGPQCLSWLLVLHRLINSEPVFHSVACGSCLAQGFHGLRYKSDRANYHLCQACFWRGKIGPEHVDDVFKEFNSFKASSGRASFKKSLQCIPGSSTADKRMPSTASSKLPHFPDGPEKPLDLTHMVPAMKNGYRQHMMYQQQQQPYHHHQQQQQQPYFEDEYLGYAAAASASDVDEHSLIAHYANQLADDGSGMMRRRERSTTSSRSSGRSDGQRALQHSRQIVHDLEKRNRDIMRDINQLKQSHNFELEGGGGGGVMSELSQLRTHKNNLEERLNELQETRKELMYELGELMKLLQMQTPQVRPQNPGAAAAAAGGPAAAFGIPPDAAAAAGKHSLFQSE